ncbi:hypothetical protein PILCRDRAFT_827596, partial [Piloderma croceum F 1598]
MGAIGTGVMCDAVGKLDRGYAIAGTCNLVGEGEGTRIPLCSPYDGKNLECDKLTGGQTALEALYWSGT